MKISVSRSVTHMAITWYLSLFIQFMTFLVSRFLISWFSMKNPCSRLKILITDLDFGSKASYLFDFLTKCFISLHKISSNFFSRFGTSLLSAQNCTSLFSKFHFVTRISSSILEASELLINEFLFYSK